MTPQRKNTFIRRAKDITISSTLTLALLTSGIALPGCGENQDNEAAYSYDETTYDKGIRSYIKEVSPGEFKITDEETVDYNQSEAIVTYLDGTTRMLNPEAAKQLIDEEIRTQGDSLSTRNSQNNYHHRRPGIIQNAARMEAWAICWAGIVTTATSIATAATVARASTTTIPARTKRPNRPARPCGLLYRY